jgi:hypothetical protein
MEGSGDGRHEKANQQEHPNRPTAQAEQESDIAIFAN